MIVEQLRPSEPTILGRPHARERGQIDHGSVICADDRVVLVGADRIAEMVMDTGLFGWLLIPAALGTAAGLFERRRSRPEGADANGQAFLLVTSLVLVATMLVMPGAVRAHHQLNSLPFLQLLVASSLVGAWSRR